MSKKPEAGDIVWVACRAYEGCEGKTAKIEILFPQAANGARVTRYICQTCLRPFHLTY